MMVSPTDYGYFLHGSELILAQNAWPGDRKLRFESEIPDGAASFKLSVPGDLVHITGFKGGYALLKEPLRNAYAKDFVFKPYLEAEIYAPPSVHWLRAIPIWVSLFIVFVMLWCWAAITYIFPFWSR